ncbi:MAG: hypothetical protein D6731_03905 [Planctomycetota bacterium]|nr:MAG: hypothetical protein D6731_03905 [Planctomycetota bacterium]
MPDDLELSDAMQHALSRLEGGKIKAVTDGDRVILMIQDAPEELRRLADALEELNVNDVSALVAYTNPNRAKSRRVKSLETAGRGEARAGDAPS